MIDDDLLVADGSGDEPLVPVRSAFETFYRAEHPAVLRLALALTGDSGLTEDHTQDAFTRLIDRFESLANPAGYVRTVLVNQVRTTHRRSMLGPRHAHLLYRDVALGEPTEVLDALAALPYRQRAVLVLRYWADWSERDIADALGVRAGTVKSLAARALGRLRTQMEDKP